MKKLFLIITVLFGLVASVNAEAKSKGIKLTDYGYNEWYEITLPMPKEQVEKAKEAAKTFGLEATDEYVVPYYVPHYSDIKTDNADLIMLYTFSREVEKLRDAYFTNYLTIENNTCLYKDVAKLTKEKRITVGLLPDGYVVINLYFSDTDTFGTFIYE